MTIRKSPGMLALEERFGKPIEQVLAETVTEQGSVVKAAELLGVKPFTFYGWLRYLRIETKTVAEAPKAVA